jgi:hypothetical protein
MVIKQKRLILMASISILLAFVAGCAGGVATRERTLQSIGSQSFNFKKRTVTLNNGIEMPILGLGHGNQFSK